MIQIPQSVPIFIMHEPVSFRNGIDGTAGVVRTILAKDPMGGAIFVFRNKGNFMLRLLFYDGSGFWLCTKRLSSGRLKGWPQNNSNQNCSELLMRELQILIWGGDPASCNFPQMWRKIS